MSIPRASTAALACVVAGAASSFRPPAVPLAVVSPFFSIWSFDAGTAATPTYFWHGDAAPLTALARIDNSTFTLLGAPTAGAPAAAQLGFPFVQCTSTRYNFSAGGVSLELRFTTPSLPDWSLEAAVAPATLVRLSAASLDARAHAVQVFFSADASSVASAPGAWMEWDRPVVPLPGGGVALRQGQVGQRAGTFNYTSALLNSTEPRQRQDYGFVYVMDAGARAIQCPGARF